MTRGPSAAADVLCLPVSPPAVTARLRNAVWGWLCGAHISHCAPDKEQSSEFTGRPLCSQVPPLPAELNKACDLS